MKRAERSRAQYVAKLARRDATIAKLHDVIEGLNKRVERAEAQSKDYLGAAEEWEARCLHSEGEWDKTTARAEAVEAWQRAVATELGWSEEVDGAIPDAEFMAKVAREHGESYLRLEAESARLEAIVSRVGLKLQTEIQERRAQQDRADFAQRIGSALRAEVARYRESYCGLRRELKRDDARKRSLLRKAVTELRAEVDRLKAEWRKEHEAHNLSLHDHDQEKLALGTLLVSMGATGDAMADSIGAAMGILQAYHETGPWPGKPVPVDG
jgi:hypothetical protein